MEVGHAITRDVPPSHVVWNRWRLFKHRYGFKQALRFILYWKILLKQETHLRLRNVLTGETLEDCPLSIPYSPDARDVGD